MPKRDLEPELKHVLRFLRANPDATPLRVSEVLGISLHEAVGRLDALLERKVIARRNDAEA